MVTVPFICPDVPPLKKNPVFMYYTDRFQKPTPSQPDIAISIDSVVEKKLDALAVMESQFSKEGRGQKVSFRKPGRASETSEGSERNRLPDSADWQIDFEPIEGVVWGRTRRQSAACGSIRDLQYGQQPNKAD
jgi:hypothetical protein